MESTPSCLTPVLQNIVQKLFQISWHLVTGKISGEINPFKTAFIEDHHNPQCLLWMLWHRNLIFLVQILEDVLCSKEFGYFVSPACPQMEIWRRTRVATFNPPPKKKLIIINFWVRRQLWVVLLLFPYKTSHHETSHTSLSCVASWSCWVRVGLATSSS